MTPRSASANHRRVARRYVAAFVLILAAITCVRYPILALPPYFDFAYAIWTEALFLVQTDFDYYQLRYDEGHPVSMEGGPRSYMTSVLPTLIALLMKFLPTPEATFVAYRLFVFACAAGVMLMMYAMFWQDIGSWASSLICLVVATTPLFCTQIDMLGFEIPLAAAAVATAWALYHDRLKLAVAFSLLAFFIKPTGNLVTLALVAFYGIHVVVGHGLNDRPEARRYRSALLLAAAAVVLEILVIRWGGILSKNALPNIASFLFLTVYWTPDLLIAFVLVALTIGTLALGWFRHYHRNRADQGILAGLRREAYSKVQAYPVAVFSALLICGTLLAVQTVHFLPRYLVFLIPLFYLFVGYTLLTRAALRRPVLVLLAVLVAINLLNWNGRFFMSHQDAMTHAFGDVAELFMREPSHFERSHEYLEEHLKTIETVRFAAAHLADRPIVAGHPYNYYLSLPALGYVDRPLDVFSASGFPHSIKPLRTTVDLLIESPRDPVYLSVANGWALGLSRFLIPRPQADDDIVYSDGFFSPLYLYQKPWPHDAPEWESWYAFQVIGPLGRRLATLTRGGNVQWAIFHLDREGLDTPLNGIIRAGLVLCRDEPREAADEFFRIVRYISPGTPLERSVILDQNAVLVHPGQGDEAGVSQDRGEALMQQQEAERALAQLDAENLDDAAVHFVAAIAHAIPEVRAALTEFQAGVWELECGRPREAATHFHAALRARDDFANVYHYLGLAYYQQGLLAEGEEQLAEALRRAPEMAPIHQDLGTMLARRGELRRAVDQFAEALRFEPHNAGIERQLQEAQNMIAQEHRSAERIPEVGQHSKSTFASANSSANSAADVDDIRAN